MEFTANGASVVLLVLSLFMIMIYFAHVPLPNTNVTGVDYILRSFYHADVVHLVSNLLVLSRLTSLGNLLSPMKLIQLLIFLAVVSSLLLYALHTAFPSTSRLTVGFSGILFGLIVVKNALLGAKLQDILTDVVILLLPSVISPNISFLGHFSGAIAGFIYVFLFNKGGLIENII